MMVFSIEHVWYKGKVESVANIINRLKVYDILKEFNDKIAHE